MRKFILFFLFVPILSNAQTSLASRFDNAIKVAKRQYVQDSLKVSLVPGVSITVSVNGSVVWSEGFGFADERHP